MQSVITLYRSHDEDLFALYETVGLREFGRLLKESLRVLARPNYKPQHKPPSELIEYTGVEDRLRLGLTVKAQKDADIEELLSHVKDRRLGAFCKMALRFYLGPKEVMSSMLDVDLVPVMSYVPTGHIVASAVHIAPVRTTVPKSERCKKSDDRDMREYSPDSKTDTEITNDTIVTALPTQVIPSRSLDMTMGDTVVMTEVTEEDEDEILALLEGFMD